MVIVGNCWPITHQFHVCQKPWGSSVRVWVYWTLVLFSIVSQWTCEYAVSVNQYTAHPWSTVLVWMLHLEQCHQLEHFTSFSRNVCCLYDCVGTKLEPWCLREYHHSLLTLPTGTFSIWGNVQPMWSWHITGTLDSEVQVAVHSQDRVRYI